ncbi:O-antigen ligase family protein [Cellulophaga baltica]|uniref:O-antigen ligase family protein n=1 Tax=Cellulophaga baltica TaxID=76594 RepID=UPI0037C73A80
MTKLKKIHSYLIPIILAILPLWVVFLGEKVVPIFIIFLIIIYLLEKKKKENFWTNNKFLLPFLIYILIYIYYTLTSENIFISIKFFERQLSMLIIPIIIFSYSWTKQKLKLLLETYLVILILICIYGFIKLGYFYFIWSDWINVLSPTYLQFKFPHLLHAHPTYWSYLLIYGNAILLSNKLLKINIKNNFWWFSFILFNITLLILSARTPLLINTFLFILSIIIGFRKNIIKPKIIIITTLLLVIILIIIFNYSPLFSAKINSTFSDERFFLWPKAFNQIKANYFIFGEGVGNGSEILKNYLNTIDDPRINYNGFDLHNQYLRNYLDMGILGFISLLCVILSPILFLKKKLELSTLLSYSVSLIFFIGLFSESALSILKGIILISVIAPISILVNKIFSV